MKNNVFWGESHHGKSSEVFLQDKYKDEIQACPIVIILVYLYVRAVAACTPSALKPIISSVIRELPS